MTSQFRTDKNGVRHMVPSRFSNENKCIKAHDSIRESLGEINRSESRKGKWMLFLNKTIRDDNGYTEHDNFWFLIKPLVNNGKSGITFATCSINNEYSRRFENGVICCFTDDYTDEEAAENAANSIREVVDYEETLYYKTTSATAEGRYSDPEDEEFVSLYRHKIDGTFEEMED